MQGPVVDVFITIPDFFNGVRIYIPHDMLAVVSRQHIVTFPS